MKTTYLFYDLETSGLNKCFDQILQFAAIRTDLALNELERHEIRIRLRPTVIPSPQALIIHRISIATMLQGETELDAIQTIHTLLNTPGTISLGYNTLGFDDEFLRFSFYRNLLPPYTHQYANQCRRMDIYPLVVLYYLYKPESLTWPNKDNRVSLKLEDLNHANQLAQGAAHDAMVDVQATVALARKLSQQQDLWSYAIGYFQKETDLARLQKLPYSFQLPESSYQEALLISSKIGYENAFQAPVLGLGQHAHYRNQTLWLRLDQETLQATTCDTIQENTFVIHKKLAEQQMLLPPHPRFLKHLGSVREKIVEENRCWLQKNPELVRKIADFHQNTTYPAHATLDAYAALYDLPFPTPVAEKQYARFHQASPKDKEQIALQLNDPIRKTLALRLLAEHYPTFLSPEQKATHTQFLAACNSDTPPLDYQQHSPLNIRQALQEIHELQQQDTLDTEQQALLTEYAAYLNTSASEITQPLVSASI